jgi:hypothetical protein
MMKAAAGDASSAAAADHRRPALRRGAETPYADEVLSQTCDKSSAKVLTLLQAARTWGWRRKSDPLLRGESPDAVIRIWNESRRSFSS